MLSFMRTFCNLVCREKQTVNVSDYRPKGPRIEHKMIRSTKRGLAIMEHHNLTTGEKWRTGFVLLAD